MKKKAKYIRKIQKIFLINQKYMGKFKSFPQFWKSESKKGLYSGKFINFLSQKMCEFLQIYKQKKERKQRQQNNYERL